jgi:hypothetical protein
LLSAGTTVELCASELCTATAVGLGELSHTASHTTPPKTTPPASPPASNIQSCRARVTRFANSEGAIVSVAAPSTGSGTATGGETVAVCSSAAACAAGWRGGKAGGITAAAFRIVDAEGAVCDCSVFGEATCDFGAWLEAGLAVGEPAAGDFIEAGDFGVAVGGARFEDSAGAAASERRQPGGGTICTILPHFGHPRISPITDSSLTTSRALHVVQ